MQISKFQDLRGYVLIHVLIPHEIILQVERLYYLDLLYISSAIVKLINRPREIWNMCNYPPTLDTTTKGNGNNTTEGGSNMMNIAAHGDIMSTTKLMMLSKPMLYLTCITTIHGRATNHGLTSLDGEGTFGRKIWEERTTPTTRPHQPFNE